jgi:hypothetical protein
VTGAGGCGVALTGAEAGEDPPVLSATTVKEYAVPFVRPVAVYEVDVVVPSKVLPEYTWYEVAPVLADHASTTCAFPGVAATFVGASGAAAFGVEVAAGEAGDDPPLFNATTVNEYAVPLVSPVAVYEVAAVVVSNVLPTNTWYDVAAELADQDSTTCVSPGVATRFVGAAGAPGCGVALTAIEAGDDPPPLMATTVNE